jgi:A/G-specific adenine glycosylase
MSVSDFAVRVIAWYDENGRKDLPWQKELTAYRVWISEIMLQQTQVQTVIPYYERFMQSFPAVQSLADASLDEVLQHWSGLGYYARARNLHRTASIIRDDYAGEFPESFEQVTDLPGIGRSTAGAILSLALGQRWPILDGNVKRVLARHAAIAGWPGKSAVAAQLWAHAEQHTPDDRVGAYTQAIMDLGATVCTRSKPNCLQCPVNADCRALELGQPSAYPGRKAKKTKPVKQTTMLLAVHENSVYLERRPAAGIWGGLWSLPEIDDASVADWCQRELNNAAHEVVSWAQLRHSFSHFDLEIQPVLVRFESASSKVADSDDVVWHQLDESLPGGIAAPVLKLINTLKTGEYVQNN